MPNDMKSRIRRITESAARASVSVHPRYLMAVLEGKRV